MSLQEWLDRNAQPGRVGGVDVGARRRREPSRAIVWLCAVFSLALLAGWAYFGWRTFRAERVTVGLGTLAYLLAGYFVHPAARSDNLGWFGGLVDNPFRFSDGANRFLATVAVLLWPGRFVAESLVALLRGRSPPGPEPALPGPPPPGSPWAAATPTANPWPPAAAPLASRGPAAAGPATAPLSSHAPGAAAPGSRAAAAGPPMISRSPPPGAQQTPAGGPAPGASPWTQGSSWPAFGPGPQGASPWQSAGAPSWPQAGPPSASTQWPLDETATWSPPIAGGATSESPSGTLPEPSAVAQVGTEPGAPPVWEAEEVVSPEHAAELVRAQFPALVPVRVAPLGVGWDNTAYRVNDAYVFRFPRREIAVPLMETETRVLPEIAARLPLAVPVPTLIGRPGGTFRWPFAGYPFLPGRTACRGDLDVHQRAAIAEPLGQFLAALHALPIDEMVALGVGGDNIGRLDLSTRIPRALEILAGLPGDALGVDRGQLRTIIESSAALRAPANFVLVHGDLYVRHLLIDEQARLCGIIDWGDVHIGNPAVDLSVAHGFLPPPARQIFLRAYARRVPAPTWWLARFRAIFSALNILDYGRKTGDSDLEREGRQSLINSLTSA